MNRIGQKGHYPHRYGHVDIAPVNKSTNTTRDNSAPTGLDRATMLVGKPFHPSPSSALVPMVTGVMRGMNIGHAELRWLGDERHWQCRLTNGPCAGLQINARGRAEEGVHLVLTPPDAQIRLALEDVLPDIRLAMSVYKLIDIRIADATYPE